MSSVLRIVALFVSSTVVCAVLALPGATTVVAQTGSVATIVGQVVDDANDEPLVGVNVFIEGTTTGTATDADGRFRISGVAVGEQILVVSQIGYRPDRRTLNVVASGMPFLEIRLTEDWIPLGEVVAEAERPFSAASSMALRAFDFRTRPTDSAQDLLQIAPGLVVAQHAGGGKAEQIFLRGFDADHGTDVALDVDGVPVNMVSHGHGQGYADLHFVIPEVVERVDVRKGPYFASYGNLATAGAVSMRTRDHVSNNTFRIEAGQFGTRASTMVFRIPTPGRHQGAYVAGQFFQSDGPVDTPQAFRRANLFGKFHSHVGDHARVSLTASGFSSAWDASGQIPQRAVDSGLISRFGAIDDQEGGTTSRQDINFRYEVEGADGGGLTMQMYATRYNFKLFSNFTFFLEDADNGDMIEQTDDRRVVGLNAEYNVSSTWSDIAIGTAIGGGFRNDDIDVSLWKSPDRVRSYQFVGSRIRESNLFAWVRQEYVITNWLRAQAGLRADYFGFNVEDDMEGIENTLPHASGYAQATQVSPKFNVVISPDAATDVFLNFGLGFHSNDARDVVITERINGVARALRGSGASASEINDELSASNFDPDQEGSTYIPRATGAEVGLERRFSDRVAVSAALWGLDLEEEFVYVGDAGTTEASGATRRYGVDLEARVKISDHLSADADVNFSRGVFVDEPAGADEIPLAPRRTASGGLTYAAQAGEVRLQARHIADRPANEDGSVTADGYTLFDIVATRRIRAFEVKLAVENLLDVAWNEAQFDTESRLRDEVTPVSEIHFTPGNPFNVRVGLTYSF